MNDRKRLNLRLPNWLYKMLQEEAKLNGISLNALIISRLISEKLESNDENLQILQNLQQELKELKLQQEELAIEKEILLERAGRKYVELEKTPKLEERILDLIDETPLSEIGIATELNEQIDVVFYCLGYLIKEGKVQEENGKFKAK